MTIEARLTFAAQLIREAGQLAARHFAHRKALTRETKDRPRRTDRNP
jgi:hypothetical protein